MMVARSTIKVKDVKEALTALLRGKYGTAYRIYGKPDEEGFETPAFFVDVRLVDLHAETINIFKKEFSVHIVYFQEDPSGAGAEADQYQKIDDIANLLVSRDARNPKGGLKLKVKDRFIDATEFSSDYTGRANNILSISFSLSLMDFKEVRSEEEDELMGEFIFNETVEEE